MNFRFFPILLISTALILVSSSFNPPEIPNPWIFTKKFVDVIKVNNQEYYVNEFNITEEDISSVKQIVKYDSYLTPEEKNRALNGQFRSVDDPDNKRILIENFRLVQRWAKEDSIDLNDIEIIRIFFELASDKQIPFYVLDHAELFVKHKSKFYKIVFNDVICLKDQWRLGYIDRIYEVDPFLNYVLKEFGENDYFEEIGLIDSIPEPPVIDTTIFVESTPQIRKANRVQKKIDKLYLKREKLLLNK